MAGAEDRLVVGDRAPPGGRRRRTGLGTVEVDPRGRPVVGPGQQVPVPVPHGGIVGEGGAHGSGGAGAVRGGDDEARGGSDTSVEAPARGPAACVLGQDRLAVAGLEPEPHPGQRRELRGLQPRAIGRLEPERVTTRTAGREAVAPPAGHVRPRPAGAVEPEEAGVGHGITLQVVEVVLEERPVAGSPRGLLGTGSSGGSVACESCR